MRVVLISFALCMLLIGERTVSDSYYGHYRQKIKSSCHDKELGFESEWLLDGHDNKFEYQVRYGSSRSSSLLWKEEILSGKLHYTATDAYCAKVNGGDCSSTEAQLAADRLCNSGKAKKLQDCIGRMGQSYHDRDYRSLSLTVSGEGSFHRPEGYNVNNAAVFSQQVSVVGAELRMS